jgi:NitT/TauT family transport system permease protein
MKQQGRGFRSLVLPPLLIAIGVLSAVECYVRLAHVRSYYLPAPSAIARAMFARDTDLYAALAWTAAAALCGFLISTAAGILLAIGLAVFPLARRAIYPYTILFQTIPIVAIAPMLVLGLGFGVLPVTVCVVIVSIFPVIVNTMSGLMSTDPALVDLFQLYGASPVASIWKLRLPAALPAIFSGLRVAAGLAVIGAIVAEIIVGETVGHAGLGVVINGGAHNLRLDRALAAVLLASGLGLGMFGLVNLVAWLALRRWHVSEK